MYPLWQVLLSVKPAALGMNNNQPKVYQNILSKGAVSSHCGRLKCFFKNTVKFVKIVEKDPSTTINVLCYKKWNNFQCHRCLSLCPFWKHKFSFTPRSWNVLFLSFTVLTICTSVLGLKDNIFCVSVDKKFAHKVPRIFHPHSVSFSSELHTPS